MLLGSKFACSNPYIGMGKNSVKWQAVIPYVLIVTVTSVIESCYVQNGREFCVLLKEIGEK